MRRPLQRTPRSSSRKRSREVNEMPLLITYFELERLKEFSQALEKVDELRTLVPVQVANIELEGEKIKLVLSVPANSLKLARESFPDAVVVA